VRKAWHGQFNRRIARKAYNSNYVSSMLYTLVATNVYEKDINDIQQKATSTFIRLQGYDISYPRAVIYGPKKMGGVGVLKLSVEGNCNKVESIITHINSKTKLGKEFVVNLNWLQIHSGQSCCVINSRKNFGYIDNNWFFLIKEFLNKIDAYISIPVIWTAKIFRENDKTIMNYIDDTDLTKPQQLIFNNWRIYLQVTNLSDIVTLDGEKIRSEYLDNQELLTITSTSKLRWPLQQSPAKSTIKIWKKGIRQIAECSLDGILKEKLGEWVDDPVKLLHYPCMIHVDFQHLLIRNNTTKTWNVHGKNFQLRSTIYYIQKSTTRVLEYDEAQYIAIDINSNNMGFYINTRGISKWSYPVEMEIETQTFGDFMKNKQADSVWSEIKIIDEELLFNNDNEDNKLVIACDGGARDEQIGSFGIVIAKCETPVTKITARIPQIHGQTHSYRSECYGILGAIQFIDHMFQYAEDKNLKHADDTLIICDNKSAVDNINY
jgi:hypothetical protein